MGRVLTNNTGLAYSIEASPGVLAGSPKWKTLEPNSFGKIGAEIKTVARSPISKERQRRKGTVVDLDSGVEFEADATLEHLIDFFEGFAFASFTDQLEIDSQNNALAVNGATGYTYTAITGSTLPANTLVFARGFSTAVNNGLKVVGASSTTSLVHVTGLTTESPTAAQNASVTIAGVRGAAGDLEIDSNGDLISTTLNFTTLKLVAGQFIHIGGMTSTNQFFTAANKGLVRITSIAANKIVFDKALTTFVVDDGTDTGSGGSNKQIDLLFGRFLRNVAVDHASYIERSFTFEQSLPNLFAGSLTGYKYPKGNFCNEMTFNLPLADKATVNFGFIGLDTPNPTSTRATGASAAAQPVQTAALNTSADILRLRIAEVDETGITTDFKDAKLSLKNNVTPEKVLGTLGAKYMNAGNFEVDLETQLLFTNEAVATAIRGNRTVSLDFGLRNDDGGFVVDLPSCTLGDGSEEFPVNESVLINTAGQAFKDSILGTSIGISLFPVLPAP